MIHIATVHWLSPDWIEIQRRYLDRFMTEPFRVVASLEGIDDEYERFFDEVVPSGGSHAGKLNLLGRVILEEADDDDLIVFLDGDAFPIADPVEPVRKRLATADLTAVRRDENAGDRQPHPCFCAVTARVWRELPGDWSSGYRWAPGRTDVGGNLLWLLERSGRPWDPILRTNRFDAHPVLCGVYGGFVYHHGAGFRPGFSTTLGDPTTTNEGKPMSRDERIQHNALVGAMVRARIEEDPDFFRVFVEGLTEG